MKICRYCGYHSESDGSTCPACGLPYAGRGGELKEKAESPGAADGREQISPDPSVGISDFLDCESLLRLASCYENGLGVPKNEETAKQLFYILAMRGNTDGMYRYALRCLQSDPPETETALFWLNTAAANGHVPSRLKLAAMGFAEAGQTAPSLKQGSDGGGLGSFADRVRQVLPYCVMIQSKYTEKGSAKYSAGSGFILEGGYVVTNAHVIGFDSNSVSAASFEPGIDQQAHPLDLIALSKDYDVAVLRFLDEADGKYSGLPCLALNVNPTDYGEEVYSVGNPLNIGISFIHGCVSAPSRKSTYLRLDDVIQVDFTANHGNSGGALFDRNNHVIGMVTYSRSDSEGDMAMCVPSKYIVKVLNGKKGRS